MMALFIYLFIYWYILSGCKRVMLVHRGGTKCGVVMCSASNINTESALCHPLLCRFCCRPGGGANPGTKKA